MRASRGDTDGALEHYTRCLHIDERLSAADPDNTQYQRDVVFALHRVGDMLRERGDTAEPSSTTPDACISTSDSPPPTPTTPGTNAKCPSASPRSEAFCTAAARPRVHLSITSGPGHP